VKAAVELTKTPIDMAPLHAAASTDGALCLFAGIVRDHNAGREVRHLEYEAYEEMALPLMRQIANSVIERWPVTYVRIVHRLGRMEIGDVSVAIAITSAHRVEAFEACRYAIDTLKRKVPIWKKEFYADGAVWVDGSMPAALAETTNDR